MKNMGQSEAERYRRAVLEAEEDQKRLEQHINKRCDCGKPATYTFITTFMGYLCDEHARELQDEARAEPEKWQAQCTLLHSVEESDSDRERRWIKEDVLWDE